jgi:hypothetical protein
MNKNCIMNKWLPLLFVLLVPLTAIAQTDDKQQELQQRAENYSKQLIDRWHQTLGVKSLFDELLVDDKGVREALLTDAAEYYRFVHGAGDTVSVMKDVSKELLREWLYEFLNSVFLNVEYHLAFDTHDDIQEVEQIAQQARDNMGSCSETISVDCLQKSLKTLRSINAIYRDKLKSADFSSSEYRLGLQGIAESNPIRIEQGDDHYQLPKTLPVIYISRGALDLILVEKNSGIKLAAIKFDPN